MSHILYLLDLRFGLAESTLRTIRRAPGQFLEVPKLGNTYPAKLDLGVVIGGCRTPPQFHKSGQSDEWTTWSVSFLHSSHLKVIHKSDKRSQRFVMLHETREDSFGAFRVT